MKLLQTIRPTTFQQQVIASIIAAETPKMAATQIAANQNLQTARDLLAKLGIITYTEIDARLTERGTQLAVEENIADESGELTDHGQSLISGQQQQQQPPNDDMGMDVEAPDEAALDVPPPPPPTGPNGLAGTPVESMTLLQQMLLS